MPLLASNSLLDQLGMVLDMPNNRVTFAALSTTVPLLRVGGHLTVRISEFSGSRHTWNDMQHGVDWSNPPPELVVQGEYDRTRPPSSALSADARTDQSTGHAPAMVAKVAALREEPRGLPEELLRDADRRREDGAAADRDLRDGATQAGQPLRAPSGHMQAPRLCPIRQRLRQVRPVQAVPQEVAVERRQEAVGRAPRQGFRHQVARFATSLAIFLQYCSSGFDVIGNTSASLQPGISERGFSEDLLGTETWIAEDQAKQRQRDGGGPVATPPGRDGPGLRLGTRRRLKGDWARSARILESEIGMYEGQPSTSTRPPPTVDILIVYDDGSQFYGRAPDFQLSSTLLPATLTNALPEQPEARQHALRALRRLRPYVLYFSFLNRPLGGAEYEFMSEMISLQTHFGNASVVVAPSGPSLLAFGSSLEMNHSTFGTEGTATTCLTTIPGASGLELHGNGSDYGPDFTDHNLGSTTDHDYHAGTLLHTIQDYVRNKDPARFGIYQAFVTYQSPVAQLEQWDEIADMLGRSFGTPGTRPFYIDPSSEMGRKIAELFRMRLEKIQAVQMPSQRRLPQDTPYTARAAFLIHNDGTKTVEAEDLSLVTHPKQRFSKPVRCGLLVYGHLIPEDLQDRPTAPEAPVPGLPTEIAFPDLSPQVPVEVRRSIARAHINLGHPTAEELLRMAATSGTPSSQFIDAIRKLRCSTCLRLKGPQAPKPATATATASQFGDRVEVDIFYIRDLTGQSCMVLGAVDVATRFHQAALLQSRDPQEAYDALDSMWLRPFGLMSQIGLDPDTTFQGPFQERLRSHGVQVDYCPAEAHWKIGHVERQNAFLRTVLEKLVDTFAATGHGDLRLLLAPALHACNSMILSRGRSAYQAVFGRVPRLPGGLLTDANALAVTPTDDPAATAEIIRAEAMKTFVI